MNLSEYKEVKEKYIKRIIWCIINKTIFRCLIGRPFRFIRNMILISFGADIYIKSTIYNSCTIWAPWKLKVGKYSCIGPNTIIYNKDYVIIEDNVVISQNSTLCTASHDIEDIKHTLVTAPIIVENRAWVASEAFIGMGVRIGEGAVVGARAAVFKNVKPWTVVGGNPAKYIKDRVIKD